MWGQLKKKKKKLGAGPTCRSLNHEFANGLPCLPYASFLARRGATCVICTAASDKRGAACRATPLACLVTCVSPLRPTCKDFYTLFMVLRATGVYISYARGHFAYRPRPPRGASGKRKGNNDFLIARWYRRLAARIKNRNSTWVALQRYRRCTRAHTHIHTNRRILSLTYSLSPSFSLTYFSSWYKH